jgi:sugar phosphate isomerase/epimerase
MVNAMAPSHSTDPAADTLKTRAKGVFPFTLACPSFVYRAGYPENVQRLAPFVDEIQLLFFESRFPDSLPSPALIDELVCLGMDSALTFNVHLPSDIFLGHPDAGERQRATDVLIDLIKRCAPLNPSTFTLHLERDPGETTPSRWQAHTIATLQTVLEAGIDSRRISIENLNYDFNLAAPIVEAVDLSVCMDMGHLLAHSEPLTPFYERWQDRIPVVHLHGVDGTQDHLPLDRMSADHLPDVLGLLSSFGGVVTLEVYSEAALEASLAWLKEELRAKS